jgi:3-deoxy-D-manno-octulosonic-acid transferase
MSLSLLYQLGLGLVLLVAGPFLLLRKGGHYLPTLPGRLGLRPPPASPGGLWIHAVSVGEAGVAATLAAHLPPTLPLLVTTITPTGQERALRLLGGRAAVAYLPFDLGPLLERFLARTRPEALVLVEGDYWPELLRRCGRRGVRVAVVNGRVGDRSFLRLSRAPRLARWLLGGVERFAVQTGEDARRLAVLGVDASRVEVTGNLKYEAPEPEPLPELEARLLSLADGRPVLLAGSTMAGEEAAVVEAFRRLGGGERALLALAPRHPERWEEVGRLLAGSGLAWVRRSALGDGHAGGGERSAAGRPAALLLDSLGELAALYRLADACFVGGTLGGNGGHNPLEPARYGKPTAVGPSMENFRDMAEQFDRAAAWRRVDGERELAEVWREWLDDPAAAASLGERARRLVEENRGALRRTLAVLSDFVTSREPAGGAAAGMRAGGVSGAGGARRTAAPS